MNNDRQAAAHKENLAFITEALTVHNKSIRELFNAKCSDSERRELHKISSFIGGMAYDAEFTDDVTTKTTLDNQRFDTKIKRAEMMVSVALKDAPEAESKLARCFASVVKNAKYKDSGYAETLETLGTANLERIFKTAYQLNR
jgi:hypothetical protein